MSTIFFLGVGSWLIAWASALGLQWLARAAVAARPLTLFDTPSSASDMETTT
ncbi:hypothetical protein FB548_2506 [Pseudoxanthomonas sp. 3HH-4]|uniref:hypothetical protein n=1 Tax=Pseudoxanthomonas sp. 3HH-4 TaxID=1690214 RepID=UPI00116679ED|nr:hypothetical protein [Pseudoxanthomonas sp. 3HH-4]TQM10306.1 hypothetical protein FB548_2506 [Pseudoxanthomonas sp. 3HH-4]